MRLTRTPLHARLIAALVAVMTTEALSFETWPVVAVAAAASLVDGALRPSPFAWLARQILSSEYPRRPDGPGRRGSLIRAGALAIASALLASGIGIVGAVLAGVVALDAVLDALTGRCPSRRINVRPSRSAKQTFGLSGDGPWLVAVSARECDLCERVVGVLLGKAQEPVSHVLLEDRAHAGELVRLVPTALRVSVDDEITERLSGPRTPEQIEGFLARPEADSEAAAD